MGERIQGKESEAALKIVTAAPSLPLNAPTLQGNEWKYIKKCLDTAWVSSAGPFVTRFEREFASFTGARHATATVNGTAALHLALRAVGVEPGDEVLVPDLTFIAPVNAIRYCGGHPVLIDADPRTWQMDADKVEDFLSKECVVRRRGLIDKRTRRRVRAILPVHLLGLSCEIDRIVRSARRRRLKVVEDAAEAVGVRYRGKHVGTFGDIGVFSFNGNKIMTAGGGGMLVSNTRAHTDYARYLSTQAKDDPSEYFHEETGYNYRLNNIQAALGLAQLEQVKGFIRKKRLIAKKYERAFASMEGVTPMPTPPHVSATYWLYTILLGSTTRLAQRKAAIKHLAKMGIGARPLWHTMHDLPPNKGCRKHRLEHSRKLYERAISLPSSVGLSTKDIERCLAAVKRVLR